MEPIKYILDDKGKRTLQYVPLLKFLRQLFADGHIFDKALDKSSHIRESREWKIFVTDFFFKGNSFLSEGELKVLPNLYVADFEICKPLGTSRKKHKICAVYWNLNNLPPRCHSSLSSIYLALLCRSEDVREWL